jgi:predicted P-loop ATPase
MNTQPIKIALCNRKTDRKYKNREMSWQELKERNAKPIRTSETIKEYPKLPRAQRDQLKDQGGFVGGWLKKGLRKNGHVISRTVGSLDADHIESGDDFLGKVKQALEGVSFFIYSTHSHTPENPRYRVVIRFLREVSEDEYPAVMRMVAKRVGMDFFDDCTYQANRMMYWASCPSDAEFVFEAQDGEALDLDRHLAMYHDWKDTSQWPTSSRESEVVSNPMKTLSDPLAKEGLVGAFCRAYHPIDDAIETFLSDVYEHSTDEGRYNYIPADSASGLKINEGKFAYSFHASDPACQKMLNAFDLVRIHRFGEDDPKKSFNAMTDLASKDERVKALIFSERRAQAEADFVKGDDNWKEQLVCETRSTVLKNCVWNMNLILDNDPDFAGFAFNDLAGRVQVISKLPWDRPAGNSFWRDADTAQLISLIDIRYGSFSSRNHDISFTKTADDRHFHPIRDYLDGLPAWDGVKRVEELFIRYLKADDTLYTRAITRKTFAAAVARIYRPGTKFDSVLVLDGEQGIGKSTIVKDLVGGEYYSETLSLADMESKAGAEKLQGVWIAEIGELAGMKKMDIEKVKAFFSTSDDKYRPSYGKTVESHPRQCVIIATVNGEHGYLRDITGNRRYWVIKSNLVRHKMTWQLTEAYRTQFWAEAKAIWEGKEKLYLEGDFIEEAEEAQGEAMESDEREGLVRVYLDTSLPENWDAMDMYERRAFFAERNTGMTAKGTATRTMVCNMEIWCECYGNNPASLKKSDSYEIAAIMQKMDRWKKAPRTNFPIYGRQRSYVRDKNARGSSGNGACPSIVPRSNP